jgi:glycosyltransferase involved in cell wall biosynthesis
MKLSAVVITFNEEKNIERFLNSVNGIADEIVVVDSFSTDRTQEIAERFDKVRLIRHPFDGYGMQKNFALSQCKGEWILFPDADEIIDETAKNSIRKTISGKGEADFYEIEFNNILLGKHLKYGGWGSTFRERFFRNGHGKYSEDRVHEKFLGTGTKGILEGRISHYTYSSITQHVDKINRYSDLMADKYAAGGKKVSVLKIVFSPYFTFLKNYLFKLGFLDGLTGFYAAVTTSYYSLLKYLKLHEKLKSKSSS